MVEPMSVMNQRPEREVFEEIAQIKGTLESFVEKDWFVTQIIGIIAGIQHEGFEVIFTGGTALSKAHHLLQRFSEDVDFRVRVQNAYDTRPSRSAFKNKVVETLRLAGFTIEDDQIKARDENRFFSIDLFYQSYFPPAHALRPHVLIEVTTRDVQLSPLDLPVSSFVNEVASRPPEVASIRCIDPVESAADKLSAIAWRIPDRIRGGQGDDPSLVRHLHDLAILKTKALKHDNFPALVAASMQQDLNRPRNDLSIPGLERAEKFRRMLDELKRDKKYAQEYARFVEGVSYATNPKEKPSFTTAVSALKRLVRALKLDTGA